MKIARTILGFVFASIVLYANGCATGENKNENRQFSNANLTEAGANTNLSKDDLEELAKIIKLPLMPEESAWREDNFSDSSVRNQTTSPNGKKLVAVLKFSQPDADQITARAEKYKPPIEETIDPENWFPAELVAKSQLSGDETLRGISFAADDFLQAPFTNGKLTRVAETDFFILELRSF